MRFPKPPIADPMGESFSAQDFECLAYNIHRMVKARTQPGSLRVVELGTWSGQSTLAIAQPHVLVHCLSSWRVNDSEPESCRRLSVSYGREDIPAPGSPAFEQFVANTRGFVFRTVMPCICDPRHASSWWPEKLDAIVVNGDTNAAAIRQVIHDWSRHVRSGGVIYGVFKDHTVAGLTDLGHYTVDGTIWRHRVQGGGHAVGL